MANPSSNDHSLVDILRSVKIRNRFEEMLGEQAGGFINSVLTTVNNNDRLKACSPGTILSAASTAAALKLPIIPSLGLAYIVPYRIQGGGYQAAFQIGWKGFVQLAMRSAQYRRLNASKVYEGQIKEIDFITGEPIRGEKISDRVIGYIAYMELINGFNKTLYMTFEDLKEHAKKYSQSYAYDVKSGRRSSVWSTNFDAMAKKTVLKLLLSKYGIMNIDSTSADMARALAADQSVIQSDGTYRYIDNEHKGEIEAIPFIEEDTVHIEAPMEDDYLREELDQPESDFEVEEENLPPIETPNEQEISDTADVTESSQNI